MSEDMIARKNGSLKKGKKIELYSAHDINVAAHLLALGVDKPHVPYFTSAVILELYRVNDVYYVQVSQINKIFTFYFPKKFYNRQKLIKKL